MAITKTTIFVEKKLWNKVKSKCKKDGLKLYKYVEKLIKEDIEKEVQEEKK